MRAEKTGRVELDRLHNSVKLVEKKSAGPWDELGAEADGRIESSFYK